MTLFMWCLRTKLALLLLLGPLAVFAQHNYSAHFLPDDWRAAYTNPALMPQGLYIALPGIYNNLSVTNLTYNDLISDDGRGGTVVDIDAVIDQLGAENELRQNLDLETIGIAFTTGPVTFSLGHRARFNGFVQYPKTLPQLIWQGNAQFIGQTVDFSTDLDIVGYHEIALGAAVNVGKQLRIGGRAKLLSGIGSANTERNRLTLETSDDIYQLMLDADFRLNNSGAVKYDGVRDVGIDFGFGDLSLDKLFSKNAGMAFDIGATLDLGRLTLTASALDLGGDITWDTDVSNYTLSGVSTFEGLDAAQAIFEDSTSFGSILDTLVQVYEPTETQQAYTTSVGSQYYFSALYDVTDFIQIGGLFFTESLQDVSKSGFAVSGSYQMLDFLRVGATYAWRNERFDNLGANATLSFGPARLILATDNIVTAFAPKNSQQANFRIGLALHFADQAPATGSATSSYY